MPQAAPSALLHLGSAGGVTEGRLVAVGKSLITSFGFPTRLSCSDTLYTAETPLPKNQMSDVARGESI